MRASRLLGSRVVDRAGRDVGGVRDIRVVRVPDGRFRVVGLVLGDGRLAWAAHGWGFAEGRAEGPWVLRKLFAQATRHARFVPSSQVVDWGPGVVRIQPVFDELPHLREAAG